MKRFNPEKELKKIQKGNKNKIIIFVFLLLIVGIIGATPIMRNIVHSNKLHKIINAIEPIFLLAILLISTSYIVDSSFNPFLYFRF